MQNPLSQRLLETIQHEVPHLRNLTEGQASLPRGEGKWSPKEELGHLVDSAANNHQRFVRASLDGHYNGPTYQPDDWVRAHGYRTMAWNDLTDFWFTYNVVLAQLVENTSPGRFEAPCVIGTNPAASLEFVIDDYILHLQHHIDLLLRRPVITQYPRVP